jgi:DNA-binding response OmpR family regulator
MNLGIVYLDDSEVSLEAVKDGLEACGLQVTTHRNPVTIYAALSAVKPALLLLDANMPTLDGKTICSLVKRHLPKLPIALFSSLSAAELAALVRQCGADGYIVKTADYVKVARDIRTIINRAAIA